MNFLRVSCAYFALAAFVLLSSCDECDDPVVVDPVVVNDQAFSIQENSPAGTVVGTVKVEPYVDNVEFALGGGDPGNAFDIDPSTGVISVGDSSKVDFEKTPVYEITVTTKHKTVESSSTVTINVTDMTPTDLDLISRYTFQQSSSDVVGSSDGIDNNILYGPKNLSDNLAGSFPGFGNIAFPSKFDYAQRTISLWLMATQVGDQYQIVYSSDGPEVEFGMSILSVIKTGDAVNLTYNVSNVLHTIEIHENVWYNAAIVVNDMNYSLYLNGTKFLQETFPGYVNSGNSFYDGAVLGSSRAADRYFYGMIDDLRIYDRALTDREVELIFYEESK